MLKVKVSKQQRRKINEKMSKRKTVEFTSYRVGWCVCVVNVNERSRGANRK